MNHRITFFSVFSLALVAVATSACASGPAATPTPSPAPKANQVQIAASQDVTLYEDAAGEIANSVGPTNFVGMTTQFKRRRTLLAFDVTSLPSNREIIDVRLEMRMSKTASGAFNTTLHRVTTPWSEGISTSSGMGGKGAPAQIGDPTWIHSSYPDTFWSNEGGDFTEEESATTSVDNQVRYSWSDPRLVEDVSKWITGASPNFGWLIIGDERFQKTAKRFDSREHASADRRPTLVIEFAPTVTGAGSG